MKKIISLLIAFAAATSAWAAAGITINQYSFPDDNFRAYVSNKIDKDHNGFLTDDEIANVKGITVWRCEIASLKGIEIFTNLTDLQCDENQLTELNLSNNKALQILNCRYNQLTTLDLSSNKRLEELNCFYNQLTALDLSNNELLSELYCGSNKLTELDISNNLELEKLNCSYNQLSRLFLAANTALTELDCCSNQLFYLDLTTNKQLKKLIVYNNNITGTGMGKLVESLPTVNNGELYVCRYETFAGKSNFITSEQVNEARAKGWKVYSYGDGNWVIYGGEDGVIINEDNFPDPIFRAYVSTTAVDNNGDGVLSKNEIASTKHINLYNRGITTMRGIEFFTALESLYCYGNQLKMLDVRNNKALKELNCSSNQLMMLDLSESTALETLECGNNLMTKLDVSNNKRLKIIECQFNIIREDRMDMLVNSLPTVAEGELRVYRYESFTGNKMTPAQVQAARNKGWRPMKWDGNAWVDYEGEVGVEINETNFPDPYFRAIVSGSAINRDPDGVLTPLEISYVRHISVSYTGITNLKGVEVFTEMTMLSCESNQMTELDVSGCPKLTHLYCGNNQLTELDLSKNTQLKELICSYNQLTELDLSQNTELTKMYCDNNQLTTLDLSKNAAFKEVYCYQNAISGEGVDKMISNLPATADVMFGFSRYEEPGTNTMTPKQVKAAKERGWKPMLWTGTQWVDYEGDPVGLKISEKQFPDQNFRACVAGSAVDKDEDGYLTDEEIAAVTSLNVANKNIASLEGIELFKNLEELDCHNNQLTTVDVSKMKALKKLDCSTNLLTGLDVSKNKSLIELRCHSNSIRDENMEALVSSLPTVASGHLYIFCYETETGNVITSLQVQAAKAKGWSVLVAQDFSWTDYDGEPVDAELSFDKMTANATYGSTFIAPKLVNPIMLDVTYSSSNTNVATVNETTGKVTIVGAGTTYISATFEGNSIYNPISTRYRLNVSKIMPTVEAPKAIEDLTVNGEPQPLVTPGTTDGGEMQYSLDGETWSTDIPTGTYAGDYTIYYKVVGNEYYKDVDAKSLTVTMVKAMDTGLKFESGNVTATYAEPFTPPTLINPHGLTVTYSSTDPTVVAIDATTGETTIVGVGTALISAMFEGNDIYEGHSAIYFIIVNKNVPTVTAPVAIEGLTVNGEPQQLIVAGSTTGGEMLYSLDGTTWSTDIPTATEAGEYTVYYKVVGNENYKDVAQQSITVAVAKAVDTDLTFETIEVDATCGESFTAPTLSNPHGQNVTYSSSNPEVATVNATTGEVTIVGAGTAVISAVFEGNAMYEASTVSYTLTVAPPTAIGGTKADANDNDAWYTTSGRRLNSRPTSKGVYIHKGRKVVVK